MPETDAQRRARARYAKKVGEVRVRFYPTESALESWVRTSGGSTYLKNLAQKDMEEAMKKAIDPEKLTDGWHKIREDCSSEYYIEDGEVTRATKGEGLNASSAYLYYERRDGALCNIEWPVEAEECVRHLLRGDWVLR